MRKRWYLLFLLFVTIISITGCTTADVESLEQLLADLGIEVNLEEALQQAGIEIPDIGQMVQTGADDLLNRIRSFHLEIPNAVRLAMVAAGAVLAVAGGKLYRAAIAAPGFALGFVIGYSVLNLAEELPDLVVVGVALIIGAVGAGLALAVHDTALVIIGAAAGGFLIVSLLIAYAVEFSAVFVLIMLVCAIAGGIGLMLIGRSMEFVLGALVGAALISLGLVENLNLFIIVPVALIGIGIQLGVKYYRQERKPRPASEQSPIQPAPSPQSQRPGTRSQTNLQQPVFPAYSEPEHAASQPNYQQPMTPAPKKKEEKTPQILPNAKLTYWKGAGPSTVYIDKVQYTIGSDYISCDLALEGLAPVHAIIFSGIKESKRYYYLQNQVDPMQLQVNGKPTRATYLRSGDIVRLGEQELRFSIEENYEQANTPF